MVLLFALAAKLTLYVFNLRVLSIKYLSRIPIISLKILQANKHYTMWIMRCHIIGSVINHKFVLNSSSSLQFTFVQGYSHA